MLLKIGKAQYAWGVMLGRGCIVKPHDTRTEAIKDAVDAFIARKSGESHQTAWRRLKKQGFRCAKLEIYVHEVG